MNLEKMKFNFLKIRKSGHTQIVNNKILGHTFLYPCICLYYFGIQIQHLSDLSLEYELFR